MPSRIKYIEGQTVGNCIFIEDVPSNENKRHAKFKCSCGNLFISRINSVAKLHTLSCGCEQARAASEICLKRITHGASVGKSIGIPVSTEYSTWAAMRKRCLNPNDSAYPDYGGRGIKVCERWVNSFENFLEDMGRRPSSKHTLDRFPNNDGDYEKSNCRWATMKEQCYNRRSNVHINYNGETKALKEWAEVFDVPYKKLHNRINYSKWDFHKAITTP